MERRRALKGLGAGLIGFLVSPLQARRAAKRDQQFDISRFRTRPTTLVRVIGNFQVVHFAKYGRYGHIHELLEADPWGLPIEHPLYGCFAAGAPFSTVGLRVRLHLSQAKDTYQVVARRVGRRRAFYLDPNHRMYRGRVVGRRRKGQTDGARVTFVGQPMRSGSTPKHSLLAAIVDAIAPTAYARECTHTGCCAEGKAWGIWASASLGPDGLEGAPCAGLSSMMAECQAYSPTGSQCSCLCGYTNPRCSASQSSRWCGIYMDCPGCCMPQMCETSCECLTEHVNSCRPCRDSSSSSSSASWSEGNSPSVGSARSDEGSGGCRGASCSSSYSWSVPAD